MVFQYWDIFSNDIVLYIEKTSNCYTKIVLDKI